MSKKQYFRREFLLKDDPYCGSSFAGLVDSTHSETELSDNDVIADITLSDCGRNISWSFSAYGKTEKEFELDLAEALTKLHTFDEMYQEWKREYLARVDAVCAARKAIKQKGETEFTTCIGQCDKSNLNGHIYPREEMEKAIVQYNEGNSHFGTAMRYAKATDLAIELEKISHQAKNLRIDEKGNVFADITILNTPMSTLLKKEMEAQNISFRIAGIGSISSEGIVSDFHIISVNYTSEPA